MTVTGENLGGPNGITYFEHSFGEYSLKARILYNEINDAPLVMTVHGARSDFAKSDAMTVGLVDRGYSILGFNMSGHSPDSKTSTKQNKLSDNINEAMTFYTYLDPKRKKKIIAHSLGATPALKTLGANIDQVDRVVLFGPAIYSIQAYDRPFGDEFRSVISVPFSYRDNDIIPILKKYQGELLIVKGEYDGLDPVTYGKPAGTSVGNVEIKGKVYYSPIPKEVIDLIYNALPAGRIKMIEIPGCDHGVVPWIADHPNQGSSLLDGIAGFLQT